MDGIAQQGDGWQLQPRSWEEENSAGAEFKQLFRTLSAQGQELSKGRYWYTHEKGLYYVVTLESCQTSEIWNEAHICRPIPSNSMVLGYPLIHLGTQHEQYAIFKWIVSMDLHCWLFGSGKPQIWPNKFKDCISDNVFCDMSYLYSCTVLWMLLLLYFSHCLPELEGSHLFPMYQHKFLQIDS